MATAREIADQLTAFSQAWPAQMIEANVPGALDAFTEAMANVGIVYGDNAGSRQRSPTVNGHYIGELLDMLHTLNQHQNDLQVGRFVAKLEKMIEVLEESGGGLRTNQHVARRGGQDERPRNTSVGCDGDGVPR